MSEDNFKGAVRSTLGKAEQVLGEVSQDKSTVSEGRYDPAAGKAQSAGRSAKDAIGMAAHNISQSPSAAQDKLMSLESEVGSSIQKNPWRAVVIAALVGVL